MNGGEVRLEDGGTPFTHRITQIKAVCGVFVLLPGYFVVLVLVVVFPVFVHILLDVPPLPVFDPVVQLCMSYVAVLVCVNAVHDLPVGI